MSNFKEKANTAKLARLIWIFMFLVLIFSPFFPGKGTLGFYSIEWSFFFFVFFLMFVIFLTWGMRQFSPRWDSFYTIFLIYWLWGFIAIFGAPNKVRAILFWGQYIPFYFILILCISLIVTENILNDIITKLTYLGMFFCLIVSVGFIYFRDRGLLNDFMLDKFQIDLLKVLPYIELPLCVAIYRTMAGYKSRLNVLLFILGLALVVISGSRGSCLILLGILGLALFKSKYLGRAVLAIFLAGFLVTALLILNPYTADRFGELAEGRGESVSRVYTGMVAFQTMKDNPVLGIGMGNLSEYSLKALANVAVPDDVRRYWNSKNMLYETTCAPLKMGGEIGVVGFFTFFAWYFILWRRIKVPQKNQRGKALQTLIGLEIYVIASFVHNFGDLGFYNYYSWVFYGVVLAAARIYGGHPKVRRN